MNSKKGFTNGDALIRWSSAFGLCDKPTSWVQSKAEKRERRKGEMFFSKKKKNSKSISIRGLNL